MRAAAGECMREAVVSAGFLDPAELVDLDNPSTDLDSPFEVDTAYELEPAPLRHLSVVSA